ncbi:MAG: hypothetical protein ACJ764_01355 [Solirubrobacteraceae bacterium]
MFRRGVSGLAVLAGLGCCAGIAAASGPVGALPKSNFAARPPARCYVAPRSVACINAAVAYLDKARARLHQGPYKLPANFARLTPPKQALILVNLDRIRYGLPPITGLTRKLDADANRGVRADGDPRPSSRKFAYYTSNWALGLPNLPFAYGAWMYDDGPGSGNLDCVPGHPSGCWTHRKDVLWRFAKTGRSAMGAAAGKDRGGRPGYAMLLGRGTRAYHPTYTYTWKQAVADGAGRHHYAVHARRRAR